MWKGSDSDKFKKWEEKRTPKTSDFKLNMATKIFSQPIFTKKIGLYSCAKHNILYLAFNRIFMEKTQYLNQAWHRRLGRRSLRLIPECAA